MDQIKKYLACEGRVNIICAETTELVEKARKIHDLSPVATAALGRLLTIGTIMGSNLKEANDNITLQIKADGKLGKLTCVAYGTSNVKGYVENPTLDLPLKQNGKLDVGTAVGKNGFLYVIKDIKLKEPYVGITPLVSGEIAEDFTKYFAESEQKPSVISLGVLVDSNGVKKAGGYFITLMPDAIESDINQIEKAVNGAEPISKMLAKNMTLQQIAETVTADSNLMVLLKEINPKYECNCNKDKFLKSLLTLNKEDLQHIFENQPTIETKCEFCGKKYELRKEQLL